MGANLIDPRPDIVYLRRRLKRGESAPVQAEPARVSILSLDGNQDTPASMIQDEVVRGATVPNAVGLSYLREVNDAYRLNKRQSAIGSLIIGNAMVAGWQMQDGSSGYIYNEGIAATESPEHKPKEYNKRPLVEFRKELLVVGLRNFKQLKRLIVVPKTGETLQSETIGGSGVVMEFEPFTALYISVIDSVIELRKEDFRGTLTETFNLHTVKPQNAHPETPSLRTLFS
jgi:hypothetical protein